MKIVLTAFILIFIVSCSSTTKSLKNDHDAINFVQIHVPFGESYECTEHFLNELPYLGDNLGVDCSIARLKEINGRLWMRKYDSDGKKNEDWYGWNQDILAPFQAVVESVYINSVVNQPGKMGKGRASGIVFLRADGVRVVFAHVQSISVKEGDTVVAGQTVAKVGNNGFSRAPHTHIGAWKDKEPLQIRFNLNKNIK